MMAVQYWNLSGNCVRDILGHRLQILSSKIQKSPIDSPQLVPTRCVGTINKISACARTSAFQHLPTHSLLTFGSRCAPSLCCRDTPYDFRSGVLEDGAEGSQLIGARISETPDGLGYDTVYVLDDPPVDTCVDAHDGDHSDTSGATDGSDDVLVAPAAATSTSTVAAEVHGLEPEPEVEPQPDVRRLGSTVMRPAARLVDEASGRVMEVLTNQPCLICYSANYLQPKGNAASGEGKKDGKRRGIRGRRRRRKSSGDQDESGSGKGRQPGANPPSRASVDASGAGTTEKSNSSGGTRDESELLDDTEVDTAVDSSARHRQWGAVCLETVNYIGSLRFKQLPSMVLHPGQEYFHRTVHSFSTTGPPQTLDGGSSQQHEQDEHSATETDTSESTGVPDMTTGGESSTASPVTDTEDPDSERHDEVTRRKPRSKL